jgi:hypothetical protein
MSLVKLLESVKMLMHMFFGQITVLMCTFYYNDTQFSCMFKTKKFSCVLSFYLSNMYIYLVNHY